MESLPMSTKSHDHTTTSPSLWRNHNYLLLQGGQIVSYVGNQQQFIALPLLILALTGSVLQGGIVMGLSTIAVIAVSPLAAALVHTRTPKTTLFSSDPRPLFLPP